MRRARLRFHNRFKSLLCVLVSFALPVLWQACALVFVYPYRLKGTAPALPWDHVSAAAEPAALREALQLREQSWLVFVGVAFLIAWALTLISWLLWRVTRGRAGDALRRVMRAKRAYRVGMLWIIALNAGVGLGLWQVGVSVIAGRTAWDYIAYFGGLGLNLLAAWACFRLAAPPVISGKHAFFKRL